MEPTTVPNKSTKETKASKSIVPAREAIEFRAYELFLQRGGNDGGELDDWLTAERELLSAKPARKIRAAA